VTVGRSGRKRKRAPTVGWAAFDGNYWATSPATRRGEKGNKARPAGGGGEFRPKAIFQG
jgi:hypothetical protein